MKSLSQWKKIAEDKGPFVLFGLFEPEDHPNMWDVVVSSDWIGRDRKKTLGYIIDEMNSRLTREELLTLSKVAVLYPTNEFVRDVTSETDEIEHGNERLVNCVFMGIPMKNAHIITSKKTA